MRAIRTVAKNSRFIGAVFCYDVSMNDAIYCAVFIDDAEELYRLFPPKLAKRIDLPHMTVRFVAREGKPVNPELYGKDAELIVKDYVTA